MEVLLCKMCGGKLKFKDGTSIVECEYCGSILTLPKTETENNTHSFSHPSPSFSHPNLQRSNNSLNGSPAVITCEIGHWEGPNWIVNKVGAKNIWDFKCNVAYTGAKPARKIALYVTAYDVNGAPYEPQRIFLYEELFMRGANRTKTWTPCWVNKLVSKVKVTKTKIYFTDGKVQEINN